MAGGELRDRNSFTAASQACCRLRTPAAGPSGWPRMPPPAAKIRSVDPSSRYVSAAWRAVCPEEKTGMISQPAYGGGNIGVRQARAERITLRPFAEFVAETVDVGMVNAGKPPKLLVRDKAHADCRRPPIDAPPVAVAVDAQLRVRAQGLHRGQANEFMLAMMHVPPRAMTWSCRCSIWSRSPVMLTAYMACLPVRSA